ncbi:hypothetical protein DUNSADRAFT_17776 [Dunaliella salina]|uniref:Encoded protein n=1 Tax=Dunaliella salina TaxID=3046 RepID=A0ABQ7G159_DUNSA|nr:hypothetical protein DUNSADRAFT_17776 [Dunaliella salina]|eukprot:KAF5828331.1 hypothetical protein DUNSADRAFT_17776 [Dunaliella salina]
MLCKQPWSSTAQVDIANTGQLKAPDTDSYQRTDEDRQDHKTTTGRLQTPNSLRTGQVAATRGIKGFLFPNLTQSKWQPPGNKGISLSQFNTGQVAAIGE